MKKCVVLTGAGISADSGLLTFRDAGGLWEGHRVTDVCTPEALARNPKLVIDFYNQRRLQANAAEPNAAHLALVKLAQYYDVHIITQNVDALHEKAGSSKVLHLHGELNKLRSTVDEDEIIEFTGEQTDDVRDSQGNPMRPHIVFFGEQVPMFDAAVEENARCRCGYDCRHVDAGLSGGFADSLRAARCGTLSGRSEPARRGRGCRSDSETRGGRRAGIG